MIRRLPRIVRFPGGFLIEVKQKRMADDYGQWVYDVDAARGVITINSRADLPRKLRTLAHELQHAITDYSHWLDLQARELETEMGNTLAALTED